MIRREQDERQISNKYGHDPSVKRRRLLRRYYLSWLDRKKRKKENNIWNEGISSSPGWFVARFLPTSSIDAGGDLFMNTRASSSKFHHHVCMACAWPARRQFDPISSHSLKRFPWGRWHFRVTINSQLVGSSHRFFPFSFDCKRQGVKDIRQSTLTPQKIL